MKMDTVAMVSKGGFMFLGSVCGALVSGLSQWANTDEVPNKVGWTIIIAGCVMAGCTQMTSFLSNSFGQWNADRANGNGKNGTVTTPTPAPPTP